MPPVTRTSTPANVAANQANGRLSRGPATTEGKEPIRDANTRHGFYSRAPGEALRILGEDPEESQRLLESLMSTWQPADEFQKRLVQRLARALLRMERAYRVQESMAVRKLEWLDERADRTARAGEAEFERRLAALNKLMDAAGHANYATGSEELLTFDSLYGADLKGRPGEILILLYRLLKPQTAEGVTAPADDSRPDPLPDVPVVEGTARYALRERLLARLRGEIDAVKAEHAQETEEILASTSPYYRDTWLAANHPQAALMVSMEDSSFRQVERLTNLLMKLKKQAEAKQSADREGNSISSGGHVKPPPQQIG